MRSSGAGVSALVDIRLSCSRPITAGAAGSKPGRPRERRFSFAAPLWNRSLSAPHASKAASIEGAAIATSKKSSGVSKLLFRHEVGAALSGRNRQAQFSDCLGTVRDKVHRGDFDVAVTNIRLSDEFAGPIADEPIRKKSLSGLSLVTGPSSFLSSSSA